MSQKKTEMTNVSMRIILKDDIPVYQPARRLSFSENQDVNKQIDEWLEQGILFKDYGQKDLVTRVARWTLLLEEYDYEIVHRSGQRMQHVDALSRYPVTIITSYTLTARLQRAQQEDENIQNLKSLIGTNNATDFFIKNEILYKYVDGRELIAAPRDMQTELIKLAHEKGALLIR
ncbi:transposon Tf2-6 polyprotein [Trichonephila clavipes]|nr:transposon Tf2-6 polyprotein [Trichonephila clavipes]